MSLLIIFPFSSDRSIYHALGYSVFMYLKAVMTFETVSERVFELSKSHLQITFLRFRKT